MDLAQLEQLTTERGIEVVKIGRARLHTPSTTTERGQA